MLVLGGGNALGAFQAGVYEALHERGLMPDWIVGTSIGAVNGALIAGGTPGGRLDVLRDFWRPDFAPDDAPWSLPTPETARRTAAAAWTLAAGRPGAFGPALSALTPWSGDRPALFESAPLAETLARLADFDRLNDGACRYTATAVDLATGGDVVFDSRAIRIAPRHVRASAALLPMFPPVEVDGRWLVDGGVSANLPLDPVIAHLSARPTLCLAVDLLPLAAPLPTTIGEAAARAQDLIFAAQSRRTIARWRECANPDAAPTTLVRIAYADHAREVAGKALDFSGLSVGQRWRAGHAAAAAVIDRMVAGTLPIRRPGLTIVDQEGTWVR